MLHHQTYVRLNRLPTAPRLQGFVAHVVETAFRSNPVSPAISDGLVAPDSNRPAKHRSSVTTVV
ncbi:hypothetical protein AB0D27_24485 [Streptomyces sp. NPDC048415]|uniref:hypothetical protein n=1 Tax=Streptomyces sp. NPDC048415 TaxID=3154822 RepID=UPI00343C4B3A